MVWGTVVNAPPPGKKATPPNPVELAAASRFVGLMVIPQLMTLGNVGEAWDGRRFRETPSR